MASPPSYSPPNQSPLALPRQRPSLALPTSIKSRKPSLASTTTSSAHPLRQTSFPPPDSLEAQHALAEDAALAQYSPSASGSLDDFSDDNDIRSAISGPAGEDGHSRKRKRGPKKPAGRPPGRKDGAAGRMSSISLINGEDGGRGPPSASKRGTTNTPISDSDDDDDDLAGPGGASGRVPLYEGGQMTPAELTEERERKRIFYEVVPEAHQERYNAWSRSKLKTADVRRLVNQILGQSVPQNVVLVVSAYAKMFAGMLVEEAREVQGEWEAVEEERADKGKNEAWEVLRKARERMLERRRREEERLEGGHVEETHADGETNGEPKSSPPTNNATEVVPNGHASSSRTQPNDVSPAEDGLAPGGAGGLSRYIAECDRGPLLPDHLREALRRYKKRRSGGTVGFTGLSLEGRENTAARMGGRRLFR